MGVILSFTIDDSVRFTDEPAAGGKGALVCIAAFPVITLVGTLLVTPFAYRSQQARSAMWREP
jgi:hypothetical protein